MAKQTKSQSTKTKTAKTAAAQKPAKKVMPIDPVTLKTPKDPLYLLRMWNLRLAALLVLQAAALVVFGKSVTVAVVSPYLAVDTLATEAAGSQVLATAMRQVFDLPLAWVLAVMLLVLAAVYALSATLWRGRYERAITRGVNEFRWLAVGLGGAATVLTIGLLTGLNQTTTLLLLAGSVLVGSMTMLLADILYSTMGATRRLPHVACVLGTIALVLPWIVFAKVVAGSLLYDGTIPGYLWGVLGTFTAVVIALGLAIHFRIGRKGRFEGVPFTEYVFMGLGFVAATAIAWQVFVGVL